MVPECLAGKVSQHGLNAREERGWSVQLIEVPSVSVAT